MVRVEVGRHVVIVDVAARSATSDIIGRLFEVQRFYDQIRRLSEVRRFFDQIRCLSEVRHFFDQIRCLSEVRRFFDLGRLVWHQKRLHAKRGSGNRGPRVVLLETKITNSYQ